MISTCKDKSKGILVSKISDFSSRSVLLHLLIQFLYRSPAPHRAPVNFGSFPGFFAYLTQWRRNTQLVLEMEKHFTMFQTKKGIKTLFKTNESQCTMRTLRHNSRHSWRAGKDTDVSPHHAKSSKTPLRMQLLLNQVHACTLVKMLSHALANNTLLTAITIKFYWFHSDWCWHHPARTNAMVNTKNVKTPH